MLCLQIPGHLLKCKLSVSTPEVLINIGAVTTGKERDRAEREKVSKQRSCLVLSIPDKDFIFNSIANKAHLILEIFLLSRPQFFLRKN